MRKVSIRNRVVADRSTILVLEEMATQLNDLVALFNSGATLPSYADDAAAAAGGVPLNGLYRTGSAVKQRVA